MISREGYALEVCFGGCGYRASLRGRTPAVEKAVEYISNAMSLHPRCVEPGCVRHVNSGRTDMCAEHCAARRKLKNRDYGRDYMRRKNRKKVRAA